MRSDPEPYDLVVLLYPDGAVILGDAQREDRSRRMYPLEMETGVIRILLESLVCLFCLFSDLLG
jgi:hypothetical protein